MVARTYSQRRPGLSSSASASSSAFGGRRLVATFAGSVSAPATQAATAYTTMAAMARRRRRPREVNISLSRIEHAADFGEQEVGAVRLVDHDVVSVGGRVMAIAIRVAGGEKHG